MTYLVRGFLLSCCFVVAIGCGGGGSDVKSVFNEDEMAKYRQTPEEIAEGMKQGAKQSVPNAKDIEKSAKDAGT